MNEFVRFLIYSVIGAVVFMAVYTLWTHPDIIKNTSSSIFQSQKVFSTMSENQTKCLQGIKDAGEIFKNKGSFSAFYQILDSKEFTNIEEASAYIHKWQILDPTFPTIANNKGNDITVAIVKFGNDQMFLTLDFYCFNGKLHPLAEEKFTYLPA